MLRLNTFLFSHFSEKARWALDFEGVAYEERCLLPGPHVLVTRRLGRASSVPILEHDGRVVQGSSAIMDYLSSTLGRSRLTPDAADAARCEELEALADRALGLGIQRICYAELLKDRPASIEFWSQGSPRLGRAFYTVAFPAVAAAVRRNYCGPPEVVAAARDGFRHAMATFDRALEGREYLVGDRPTRVDLTVAALLTPACRPVEYRVKWPPVPDSLVDFIREFEGGPTWRHALAMYRHHRRPTTDVP